MKKALLLGLSIATLSLAVPPPAAQAAVGVGIGFSFSDRGHRGHRHHGHRGHRYYRGPRYYSPRFYGGYYYPAYEVYPAPVVVEERIVETPPPAQVETYQGHPIPYGFVASAGRVKSPWSDFTISQGGRTPGEVVYDANTGKPFRIP